MSTCLVSTTPSSSLSVLSKNIFYEIKTFERLLLLILCKCSPRFHSMSWTRDTRGRPKRITGEESNLCQIWKVARFKNYFIATCWACPKGQQTLLARWRVCGTVALPSFFLLCWRTEDIWRLESDTSVGLNGWGQNVTETVSSGGSCSHTSWWLILQQQCCSHTNCSETGFHFLNPVFECRFFGTEHHLNFKLKPDKADWANICGMGDNVHIWSLYSEYKICNSTI